MASELASVLLDVETLLASEFRSPFAKTHTIELLMAARKALQLAVDGERGRWEGQGGYRRQLTDLELWRESLRVPQDETSGMSQVFGAIPDFEDE